MPFICLFIYCTCSNMTYIYLMAMEWEIRLKWEKRQTQMQKKKKLLWIKQLSSKVWKYKHFLNSIHNLNCMLKSNWLKVVVIYVFFMNVDGWMDGWCMQVFNPSNLFILHIYLHVFIWFNECWESWKFQSSYEAGGEKKRREQ